MAPGDRAVSQPSPAPSGPERRSPEHLKGAGLLPTFAVRRSHKNLFRFRKEQMVVEIVHQQEGKDDDIIALVERDAESRAEIDQQSDHRDGSGGQADIEEIVAPGPSVLGHLVDELCADLPALVAKPVDVIGQSKILEGMPCVKTLECHVEIRKGGDAKGHRGGKRYQNNLGIM